MSENGVVVDNADPVIKKIPVYFSKPQDSNQKFYVFQYPLRSVSTEDVEKPCVTASRIKPKLQEVELELKIPTKTQNYDDRKGQQIVINTDGFDKQQNPDHLNHFEGDLMDKLTYSSTKAQLKPGRYTVGCIVDDELHLNPIHGILHMKPSFPYLDKSDKKLKNAEKDQEKKQNGMENTAESGEEEDDVEQITVKFARTETERSKQAREKSFSHLQKKNAEEPFIQTKFYASGTRESKHAKETLLCSKTEENAYGIMTRKKKNYVEDLIGETPESEILQKMTSSGPVSKKSIKQMPKLADQVKNILINAKLMSFSQLCSSLEITSESQKTQLLNFVQDVAELVQGNWVIKSEILYPAPVKNEPVKLTGVSGIHPVILTKARNYVLHLFTHNTHVNRANVTKATKIPTEEMKAILEQFSIKTDQGWKFKLPVDQSFIDKNPDVVRRYALNNQKYMEFMMNDKEEFKAPKKEPTDTAKKTRGRRRSRQDSCGSDSGNDSKKATPSGSGKKNK